MLSSLLSALRPQALTRNIDFCRAVPAEPLVDEGRVTYYTEKCWVEKSEDGMTLVRCQEQRRILMQG